MRAVLVEKLRKRPVQHKFDHGHALVLAGGAGRTGAARLAALAALRMGAGLVTLGAPGSSLMECAAQSTAVMCRRCEDAEGLRGLLDDERINALCLGPGLGVTRAKELLPVAIGSGRPLVLDADALTALARDDVLFRTLHGHTLLTPHGGEFGRLFPDLNGSFDEGRSKVDVTREAAGRARCVVLLKGAETVIAEPGGKVVMNTSTDEAAAPWLATAGSGDVLAGFIVGLLARGFDPLPAAEAGAWLHAQCARAFGPGLIAEDLPEQVPGVFRKLGL